MYFAFDIKDKVEMRPELKGENQEKVNRILKSVLGEEKKGKPGEYRSFSLIEDTNDEIIKLIDYMEASDGNQDITDYIERQVVAIANSLLLAELTEDGKKRDARIKEGLLFVNITSQNIILLKVEDLTTFDWKTFDQMSSISTEKQYYKAAIFNKAANNKSSSKKNSPIKVFERGNKHTSYWVKNFLNVERAVDDSTNTKLLFEMELKGNLYNPTLDSKMKSRIAPLFSHYIRTVSEFDFDDFLAEISDENEKFLIGEVFNGGKIDKIDSHFTIDEKVRKNELRMKFEVAPGVELNLKDYKTMIEGEIVELENNRIIITIDPKCIEEINQLFDEVLNND